MRFENCLILYRQRALTVEDEEVMMSNPMREVRVVVDYTCLEGEFKGQQFAAVYTRAVYAEQLFKELELVDRNECFLNVHAKSDTRTGGTFYIPSWRPLRLRHVLKNFVPY